MVVYIGIDHQLSFIIGDHRLSSIQGAGFGKWYLMISQMHLLSGVWGLFDLRILYSWNLSRGHLFTVREELVPSHLIKGSNALASKWSPKCPSYSKTWQASGRLFGGVFFILVLVLILVGITFTLGRHQIPKQATQLLPATQELKMMTKMGGK